MMSALFRKESLWTREALSNFALTDQRRFFRKTPAKKVEKLLEQLRASGKKWAILINEKAEPPQLVMDTDAFLRSALLDPAPFSPAQHCRRPIVIRDPTKRLGHILQRFEVQAAYEGDNVIDRDVVLLWYEEKRIIPGVDVLGRLLGGISKD